MQTFSTPERETGTPVTERRFERHLVWQGRRITRHDDGDYLALVYTCNKHIVKYVSGVRIDGKAYDLCWVNETLIAKEPWSNVDPPYPASECFALATGWYPHEFEAICDELDARGATVTSKLSAP